MENDPGVTEAIVWEGPVSSSTIVVGSTVYFGGNPMIPVKHEKKNLLAPEAIFTTKLPTRCAWWGFDW